MKIERLHISSFGALTDRDLEFSDGLNVITGPNESGKTSAVTFIKFLFYGMPAVRSGVGEREKYVNWKTGEASGYAVVGCDGKEYKVERTFTDVSRGDGKPQFRERVRVTDLSDGTALSLSQSPGEYFFGVSEQVFLNTAFVRQQAGVRPESEPLRRSAENIVCAADEGVDVKKALDSLDKARVALLYKNKAGGRIRELEAKRDALRAAMEEDQANSADTIKTEAALGELKRKLAGTEKQSDEYDELMAALDVISKKNKLDAEEKTSADLRRATEELEREKKGSPAENFDGIVAMCERNFESRRHAREALDCLPEPPDEDEEEDDLPEFEATPYEDVARAGHLRSKARGLTAAGIVFAILALLGCGAAAWLYFNPKFVDWYYVAAGAAIILLIGVIFFALGGKVRSDYREILAEWGANDMGDIAEAIRITVERKEEIVENRKRRQKAELDLTVAEGAANDSRDRLYEAAVGLAVPFSREMDDEELLSRVKASLTEKKENIASLEATCSALSGRLSALSEQTEGLDRAGIVSEASEVLGTAAGRRAASMSQDEIKEAARRRDLCHGLLTETRKRESELEQKLAALRAVAKSPADTAERIGKIDAAIEELRFRHDAYVTAYEALGNAQENLRSGLLPKLKHDSSEMMKDISSGKYSGLSISPDFDLFFTDGNGDAKEAELLSSGTGDAAYLSLRLALVKALFSESAAGCPPVVLDESFARLDEERLDAAVRLLTSKAFGLQSILCTCRAEESEAAERHGGRAIRL